MALSIDGLQLRLIEIKKLGFVPTHRAHDTGIGKTLEDLLGIAENNLQLPDVGDIEIKAKRLDSDSMLTIATKSPEPFGANRVLFNAYKYTDTDGFYNLHSTVYGSRANNQSLQVVIQDEKLFLKNPQNIPAFWPLSVFDNILRAKSNTILLVLAETRGRRTSAEEKFHYCEAYLLSGLNREKFRVAIQNDKLKIDIRIGTYRSGKNRGRYHDHGTGFRINKRDFLHIFDDFRQVL